MPLQSNYGFSAALNLVTKAIESGSIKLHGPSNDPTSAEQWAKADAAYLITLMAGIQAEMPE